MQTCIFCKIVKGEIDSAKICEDEDILAFLDVNPIAIGHCLVVPKKHFENIFDIEIDILQKIAVGAKHIAEKVKKSLAADGINLLQANGPEAGQVISHFHLHIIPRFKNDGLNFHPAQRQKLTIEELKKIALRFRSGQAE